MQFHKEQPAMSIGDFVVSTLLTATLAVSILAGISKALELEGNYAVMIITGCIGSVLMQILFFGNEKVQRLGLLAAIGVPCIAGLVCKTAVTSGVAMICNRILELAGGAADKIFLPFSVEQSVSEETALLAVMMILMLWMTCGMACLQREFHPVIFIGILFFMLIINGMLPQTASGAWLLVTGLCIGIHFAWHRLGDQHLLTVMVVLLLCITGVTGMITAAAGEKLETGKDRMTAAVRAGVRDAITESRYGDGETRSMPMGDFRNLRDLQFSDDEMLKIKGETYESLYLRGFTGGSFDGMKWTGLDGRKLTEKKSTFYWLHDGGCFGQNLLAKSALVLDPKTEENELDYAIENLGADGRVYYTPYELTALQTGSKSVLTNQLLAEDALWADGWHGWKHYEIKTLENQVKRYPELILALIENLKDGNLEDYRKAESHYNRFVYENYTQLTKEEQKLMEKYLGEVELEKGSHLGYEDAKAQILSCLDENVIYSEKLLSDGGGHFVKNFLESDKSGYSVHYATAAALMFRYFGIPARYVEGYLITPETAKEAEGEAALTLTDKDAHAWVEYYQDGIGWLPFETTPPYRDVMEQPEQLQSENSQTLSETGSTSLGMEMIEDNYEPDELEREDETRSLPWGTIAIGGLILLLLILAALTGLHLWRRRKKLTTWQKRFLQDNRNLAVEAVFCYCMLLHGALGVQQKNCSIYDYGPEVGQRAGAELEESYLCIAGIYQKAVYSQTSVSEEEWQQVMVYKEKLLMQIKAQCGLLHRGRLKWINGLY